MLTALVTAPSLEYRLAAVWDPARQVTWLLVHGGTGPALFRGAVGAEVAAFEPVCQGEGVTPGFLDAAVLFLDPTSGELLLWADVDGRGVLRRFDGAAFAPLGDAPVPASAGVLAVDPRRKVVVLVGRDDGRLHERGADGVWVAPASIGFAPWSPSAGPLGAAWDEPRGAIAVVLVNQDYCVGAWTWDGAEARPLAKMDGRLGGAPLPAFTNPKTGRAVFVPRGYGFVTLGAEGFARVEPCLYVQRVRAVSVDPTGAQLWGVELFNEKSWSQQITWTGEPGEPDAGGYAGAVEWIRRGPPLPTWNGTVDRRRQIYSVNRVILRATRDGSDGEELEGPPGDFSRSRATVIWDEEDGERVLIVAGLKPPYGERLRAARDTWEWRAGRVATELKTKGKPLGRVDGRGARDAARNEWIVVGGREPTHHPNEPIRRTEHFDGKAWTAYDTTLDGGGEVPDFAFIAADPASGQVFGVAAEAGSDFVVFAYLGAGVWRRGPELPLGGDLLGAGRGTLVADYDPAERRLVAKGTPTHARGVTGIFAASIGSYLDSLPPRGAPLAAKARKAAKGD